MLNHLQRSLFPFLCLAFLPPEEDKLKPPFPALSTPAAEQAINDALKAIGATDHEAHDDSARLKRLADELGKRFEKLPPLADIKGKLLEMHKARLTVLQLADPDGAPLFGTVKEPNPDLKHVQEQTWPSSLTHGEKVALQAYTGPAYRKWNDALRKTGTVPQEHVKVHERLQSAFVKARPFKPPVKVTRGLNLTGQALDDYLKPFIAAQESGGTVTLKGYTSTSVSDKFVVRGNIEMYIQAVHGLDAMPVSHAPAERELVLNHNSIFRVTALKKVGDKHIIEGEQLPPAEIIRIEPCPEQKPRHRWRLLPRRRATIPDASQALLAGLQFNFHPTRPSREQQHVQKPGERTVAALARGQGTRSTPLRRGAVSRSS